VSPKKQKHFHDKEDSERQMFQRSSYLCKYFYFLLENRQPPSSVSLPILGQSVLGVARAGKTQEPVQVLF